MAVKGNQVLHLGNGFVIDRIQSGGPSNLNIPEEKIYELGNYETVSTVRDIPEVGVELESFDVSTEIEAILTGQDPTATSPGDEFDFLNVMPLDIVSPWKAGGTDFDIVRGLALPFLNLESATYRFGVGQNSTQSFSLRGDAIYYVMGTPREQDFTITAGSNQVYTLTDTGLPFVEDGNTLYGYSVCARNPTTYAYQRLFYGDDYTNTSTTITVLEDLDAAGFTDLHVVYGTATVDTYNQTVHQGSEIKPAAVRGKDIDIYISDGAATPTLVRWRGVQSFEVNWRATLENDEEFGNNHYVASDYQTPEVSGSIEVKSRDANALFDLIATVTNTNGTETAGAHTSQSLEMELRINDPETGDRVKTLYVPDARILPPAAQSRVQTKLTVPFPFSSDGGTLKVYDGERP